MSKLGLSQHGCGGKRGRKGTTGDAVSAGSSIGSFGMEVDMGVFKNEPRVRYLGLPRVTRSNLSQRVLRFSLCQTSKFRRLNFKHEFMVSQPVATGVDLSCHLQFLTLDPEELSATDAA